MRLFTAIPIPTATKDKISEITYQRLPIHYINITNLHITLNFFGELSDAQVEKVKTNFDKAINNLEGFQIAFQSLEKFHQQLHLKIKPSDQLSALQLNLQKTFEDHGFKFESRPYYPHVTLGNMHMDKVMNKERKIENFPNDELGQLGFIAEKVTLYESKLLLHHAQHIPLMEHPLI